MKTKLKVLTTALLLCVSEAGHAGPVGPLTTFTAGTQAKAVEVNGNFNAVRTAVDDNAGRIGALESGAASPSVTGNITLVPSTPTAGNILKGTAPFIHNFGTGNTFIGVNAGNFTMTGDGANTASGFQALQANTTGSFNTASGFQALQANTTGSFNTASGVNALLGNTEGAGNTASGTGALQSNTIGSNNTANGASSLQSNANGDNNTANGVSALQNNTTGNQNTASGANALINNTTGSANAASGANALFHNTTGQNNTAFGTFALGSNTTGSVNIGIGNSAGINLTTGSNNIDIGNLGVAAEANTIRIGTDGSQTRTFITGIRGVTTGSATGVAVLIDTNGQLGTVSSSSRVKDDIADMGEASSALMKLRPVTFHYKSDKNPEGRTLQYGLVAEEVAKAAPGLVARSADGKIETVYYQFLAPMLLNEYQKQQRTIDAQAAALTKQTAELTKQTARIAEMEQDRQAQMSELRKHSAEIAELRQQTVRMAGLLGRMEEARTIATAGR